MDEAKKIAEAMTKQIIAYGNARVEEVIEKICGLVHRRISEHDEMFSEPLPTSPQHRDFCECFGVGSFEELEKEIRGLAKDW